VKRILKTSKVFRSRDLSLDQNIKYSHEVNKLFEKRLKCHLDLKLSNKPRDSIYTIIEENTKATKLFEDF
jgi:hypothetical protein